MFAVLESLARANQGVFTKQQAVSAGIPGHRLSRLARTGVIARLARGVYAVSHLPAELVAPWVVTRARRVVLSHGSAAAWWGVDLPAPLAAVHVTAPRNRGARRDAIAGVRLHRADLGATETEVVRGVVVTTPLRTCLDIARRAPLEEAVAIVDAFLRGRLLALDEFDGAARRATGPGRARLQTVAALVDPNSGSVLESLVRVLLWRNGMCPSASQHFLAHQPSRWKGFLDFAWPELKVALECDGYQWHCERDPFQKDRRRWSALTRMSWRLAVVTWFDVTQDPGYVVALVADLLGRPVPRPVRHTNVAWGAAVA